MYKTYAHNKNGIKVHVDSVENGAECNCYCEHCKSPLIAKNKGKKRVHHFAHANGVICEGEYETQLHQMAKNIIQKNKCIMLPFDAEADNPMKNVSFKEVLVEQWDENHKIKPDLVGITDSNEKILIEIYVTHKVDNRKKQIILENKLRCIEIDLNYRELDEDSLTEFLINTSDGRYWVTHPEEPVQSNNKKNSSGGNCYRQRDYTFVKRYAKSLFERGKLKIEPYQAYGNNSCSPFLLNDYNYDRCIMDTYFKGFKVDLLFYRNKKKDKGFIAINFRGRRRCKGFKYPIGLRAIDVITDEIFTEEKLKNVFQNDTIKDSYNNVFSGFRPRVKRESEISFHFHGIHI